MEKVSQLEKENSKDMLKGLTISDMRMISNIIPANSKIIV
jgi:hypothetical protein